MKIIFLDIDGVLNVIQQGRDEFGALFHPEFVENLRQVIDATGAKIVISSSWRSAGLERMKLMWQMRDLPSEVIDITPNFREVSSVRGEEIANWLSQNNVDSYLILDDDDDMLPDQLPNFIQCSGNNKLSENIFSVEGYGFTKDKVEKAIAILNGNLHIC